jgi:CMP-N-acetylneuraminic acid synthetase
MIKHNGKQYNFLAVIPARAGSQGIKGKNFRPLYGKPLIEWSILAALDCHYLDLIFVSTNDPEIVKIAAPYAKEASRVRVVLRPESISGPDSPSEEALQHALNTAENNYFFSVDFLVMLQPTSPIRNNLLISSCIEDLLEKNGDSLLTVSRHTPLFWKKTKEGKPYFINDPVKRKMRQKYMEDEFMWHDDGNVYISSNEAVKNGCRVGKEPVLFESSPYQSLQIDTEFDFMLIEKMIEVYGNLI